MHVSDAIMQRRAVRVGDDVLLQCELTSNLANSLWTLNGSHLEGYGLDSGYRTGTDGLLIIKAQQSQSGLYTCYAVENNIKIAVVSYNVTVHQEPALLSPVQPMEHRTVFATLQTSTESPVSKGPLPPPPAPLLPHSKLLSSTNLEAIYLSLVTILGSLCVVLTVVLIYVGFCLQVGHRGRYSLRNAAAAYRPDKRGNRKQKQHRSSSLMELKTISSHCNGNGVGNGVSKPRNGSIHDGGFLQIVPGEGNQTPLKGYPPPAPPPPPTLQLSPPECDFPGGLSATLPSVLRRMNGNSYVLLRQSDSENTSPLCHSFAEELNRILEKRNHTQLLPRPDESSV